MNKNSNQSTLADIILIIAKHFKLIALITLISLIVTFFFIRHIFIPKYTSNAILFVSEENNSNSALSGFARQFGINAGGNSGIELSSSALYPEIVQSRAFAAQLLQKEFFTEKFAQKLPLIAIFSYGTESPTVSADTMLMRTYKRVSSMIKFKEDSPWLTLMVTTEEPKFSQDLATEVLVELDKLQRKFKSQKVIEKKTYIEQQIEIAQRELERLEERLKYFRENNRQVNASPTLLLKQERLMRDVEVQKGIFLTLKQQYELTKIEEVQKSSFVQIVDEPSLPIAISNPTKISSYILGGLAGLFLGLCIAFLIEYFSTQNTSETEKLLTAKQYFKKIFRRRK